MSLIKLILLLIILVPINYVVVLLGKSTFFNVPRRLLALVLGGQGMRETRIHTL